MNKSFAAIPEWARPAAPSRFALFETLALLGLEDQYIRLSADDQRALLGFPVIGKRHFCVDSVTGDVTILRSACFGMDHEAATYAPSKIAEAAAARKQLSPGVFGPGFA